MLFVPYHHKLPEINNRQILKSWVNPGGHSNKILYATLTFMKVAPSPTFIFLNCRPGAYLKKKTPKKENKSTKHHQQYEVKSSSHHIKLYFTGTDMVSKPKESSTE